MYMEQNCWPGIWFEVRKLMSFEKQKGSQRLFQLNHDYVVKLRITNTLFTAQLVEFHFIVSSVAEIIQYTKDSPPLQDQLTAFWFMSSWDYRQSPNIRLTWTVSLSLKELPSYNISNAPRLILECVFMQTDCPSAAVLEQTGLHPGDD